MENNLHSKKIWGIVGLGWLGTALSVKLQASAMPVWGTHRDSFDFKKDLFPNSHCDVLFLNTPPLCEITPTDFVNKVFIQPHTKIIFTSSISIFSGNSGLIKEDVRPVPKTPSGQWLFEVEKLLIQKFHDQVLILRLGGLIGGQRHPAFSLSGKTQVVGGNDLINLVHREDLIEIILKLENSFTGNLLNIVTPYHPTKKEYYQSWVERLKLEPIEFLENENNTRVVDSLFLKDIYPVWKCPKLDFL